MYFKSRADAGSLLANQIVPKYSGQNCTVVALNDGGVMVGAQIALRLHCPLMLLLTEAITLPRENVAVAGMSEDGGFAYNSSYSPAEIEEFQQEYFGYIEQEKLEKLSEMHHLLGQASLLRKDLLRGSTVILVSDGLEGGFSIDVAADFLKPIRIERLVIATPLANVPAVDRMHILADQIFCLSVIEDYISTNHYYEMQDVPPHEQVTKTIEQIMLHWKI